MCITFCLIYDILFSVGASKHNYWAWNEEKKPQNQHSWTTEQRGFDAMSPSPGEGTRLCPLPPDDSERSVLLFRKFGEISDTGEAGDLVDQTAGLSLGFQRHQAETLCWKGTLGGPRGPSGCPSIFSATQLLSVLLWRWLYLGRTWGGISPGEVPERLGHTGSEQQKALSPGRRTALGRPVRPPCGTPEAWLSLFRRTAWTDRRTFSEASPCMQRYQRPNRPGAFLGELGFFSIQT